MNKQEYKRILVISLNAWNDSNATGNTISSIFNGYPSNKIANIYCRNERIANKICKNYFRITESSILKSLLHKQTAGETVVFDKTGSSNGNCTNLLSNTKTGNVLRKYRPASLLFLREFVWNIPMWKSKKLDTFLENFQPEVIYMHGHANWYMHKIMDYCRKKTGAKQAMYWADDMYGYKSKQPLQLLYQYIFRKRIRKSMSNSDLLFGGSLKLCKEYSDIFGKEFIPLFKECNIPSTYKDKETINNPILIVYAGNLLYGREEILVELAKQITKVNQQELPYKIKLIIYSNTQISESAAVFLNNKNDSQYMGCQPYERVKKALDEAELALFAESFSKDNIKKTRLSFSTKIIDCMQSSSAMLALGPETIASMQYIIENKIGITISDKQDIYETLLNICRHPHTILEMARNKHAYALKKHTNTSANALERISEL